MGKCLQSRAFVIVFIIGTFAWAENDQSETDLASSTSPFATNAPKHQTVSNIDATVSSERTRRQSTPSELRQTLVSSMWDRLQLACEWKERFAAFAVEIGIKEWTTVTFSTPSSPEEKIRNETSHCSAVGPMPKESTVWELLRNMARLNALRGAWSTGSMRPASDVPSSQDDVKVVIGNNVFEVRRVSEEKGHKHFLCLDDTCTDIQDTDLSVLKGRISDQQLAVLDFEADRFGGIGAVSGGVDLIGHLARGTAAFLKQRAEAELAWYAANELEKKLCEKSFEGRALKELLPATCSFLGAQTLSDSGTLSWLTIQDAVRTDLMNVPENLVPFVDDRQLRVALVLVQELRRTVDPKLLALRAYAATTEFQKETSKGGSSRVTWHSSVQKSLLRAKDATKSAHCIKSLKQARRRTGSGRKKRRTDSVVYSDTLRALKTALETSRDDPGDCTALATRLAEGNLLNEADEKFVRSAESAVDNWLSPANATSSKDDCASENAETCFFTPENLERLEKIGHSRADAVMGWVRAQTMHAFAAFLVFATHHREVLRSSPELSRKALAEILHSLPFEVAANQNLDLAQAVQALDGVAQAVRVLNDSDTSAETKQSQTRVLVAHFGDLLHAGRSILEEGCSGCAGIQTLYVDRSADLIQALSIKDYTGIAVGLADFVGETGEDSYFLDAMAVAAQLATAETPDDVADTLHGIAAPLGSWRAKRKNLRVDQPGHGVSITGLVGASFNSEHARKTRDYDGGWGSMGIHASIGVDWNIWGNKFGTVGLYVPLLNLSTLTSVPYSTAETTPQTSEADGNDAETPVTYNGNASQLLSLGAYVRVGLGNSPLILAGGVEWFPVEVREVGDTTVGIYRYSALLAIDTTLFAF